MEPSASPLSPLDTSFGLAASARRPTPHDRLLAVIEVVLCSGFPTQLALAALFAWLGLGALGGFRMRFVAPLLLTDTAVLIGLILLFLRVHGEDPGELFFGARPWRGEFRAAVPMVFKAYGIAFAVMVTLGALAPWLHTVPQNPLQSLLKSPGDVALFALIVIVAGGVREEVQRAFILRRFGQSLGGTTVGVVLSSIAFGAGHFVQGADAAIATALLGAFWGVSYLRRRSIVAPVVSHAAFDVMQIAVFLLTGR